MSTDSPRFSSRQPAVIAEIGNDWLKMAQTEPAGNRLVVSKLHVERFAGVGSKLFQSLTSASRKIHPGGLPVIGCLPRQMVNIRMLELPSTDPREIDDMVELQVGKQTPYSKDEIVTDFKIVGPGREGYSRILLAIVQRSVLRQRYSVLEQAGIRIQKMSLSTEGLVNWLEKALPQEERAGALVLTDVDSFYSDFCVIAGGVLLFTRSIMIGGNDFAEDAAQSRAKFGQELKRSLDMFRGESPDIEPEKIILTGAALHVEGLAAGLEPVTGIPVEVRDSLGIVRKMPKEPSLAHSVYHTVSLTALLGIGAAPQNLGLHLIPDSIALRRGLESKARHLTFFGILLMSALLAASAFLSLKVCFSAGRLVNLRKKSAALVERATTARNMAAIVDEVRKRRDAGLSVYSILSEINRAVPADTNGLSCSFSAVDINVAEAKAEITGTGISVKDVRTLVSDLEQSPLFSDVKDVDTRRDDKTKMYNFKITCLLEKSQ